MKASVIIDAGPLVALVNARDGKNAKQLRDLIKFSVAALKK